MAKPRTALLLLSLVAATLTRAQVDPDLLAGMKARAIGPASMSGRVAAIDALESNPNIVYVGAATGGVWKSVDGALSFTPLFDDQPVAAIGAVSVFQANPDIVWVGTGEGNPRNSMSVGNGVYKSLDGGTTWKHLGLEQTERIHRIILHPKNPDVAWVAAMGRAWGQNPERGVFKTTDGGKTWAKVLYGDPRTGAADLIIDPSNPDKLFAAMWEYQRWPWFFNSGGPGSGLFVTHDGGANWKRLTEEDGMPKGILGRIGLAIARSNPQIVYALVEAGTSALLRSDDGGKKWTAVNTDPATANRPFYYADIRVDPKDPNRVYNLFSLISLSTDGGRTFKTLVPFAKIHPDYHAMWIDPNDPTRIYAGNDGGVAESRDRGESWRFVSTLPLAQYYHIAVDDDVPYNIYGGMQDNGSWRGPNTTWETAGIRNWDWQEVGFGDGFGTLPIPGDSQTGYAMSQEGYLIRWDIRTGQRKDIRPSPPAGGPELRFNWNAAIAIDPFDPNTVYYGSQFIHRSPDRGETWSIISPDLTTNRPEWQKQARSGGLTPDVTGAENFTTIITIAPSARERNTLWAGTDDGRIWLTRDGGANWSSVEKSIQGVPANSWVAEIKASPHDPATAFAVFDDHRRSNWTPYVYRTTDYGRTWTSLSRSNVRGYALAIEQDPVDPDLLFLGTEFGLWTSIDAGRSWFKWTHNVPTVSVMGLAIQPREHDLVIGTHGRAAYVIDDISPLRTISAETMSKALHFFEIPSALQYTARQKEGSRFLGDAEFRAENQPYGALLTYSLTGTGLPHPDDEKERERKEKERAPKLKPIVTGEGIPEDIPKEPEASKADQPVKKPETSEEKPKVKIEVIDSDGTVIRKFEGPAVLGVNRTTWDLKRDAFKRPRTEGEEESFFGQGGPEVPAGIYNVRMKFGDHEATQTVRVLPDPREQIAHADRQAKFAAIMRAGQMREKVTEAIERVRRSSSDIDSITSRLRAKQAEPSDEPHPLVSRAQGLKKKLEAMEKRLWTPPKTKGIVAETDVWSKIGYPLYSLQSSWHAPTAAQLAYLDQAESLMNGVLADVDKLFAEDVAKFREEVAKEGIALLQ
jgi:photosystem II stability/assembly factor-like uncharacterized protein